MFDIGAVIVLWFIVDIGNASADNSEFYTVACQIRFGWRVLAFCGSCALAVVPVALNSAARQAIRLNTSFFLAVRITS